MTLKGFGAVLVAAALVNTSAFSAAPNPPPGCRAWNVDLPKESAQGESPSCGRLAISKPLHSASF
jgi:hypothetical protein